MRVDRPYLDHLEAELSKVVAQKDAEMRQYWTGDELFNANSTDHIARVLFDGYLLNGQYVSRQAPWVERNKKSGKWKTDKKTLRAIVEKTQCPFSKAVLEYRAAHKAETGFIHDIKLLSEYDGYLHTNFHLHGTSTGRLSSSDLNMQNLPSYLAGFNIKKIFLPDDSDTEILVNVDYKGAEIRIFTAYAKDPRLIDALNGGLDVHSLFVQEIYGIAYDIVAGHESLKDTNKELYLDLKSKRTNCKRVVFGILYGAMARKIAETAGITEEEAQKIIDGMFVKFPSIKHYMDETVAQIHKFGFVETLLGRRRRFPLQHVNGFFRGQAERRGKNMKIQSTSSDIVLGQLIEVDEHIRELGGRSCITVHDSIVTTCKKKYAHQLPEFINLYCVKRVAEKYPWLPVEFSADVEVGPSYGEGMNLEKYLKQERDRPRTEGEMLDVDFDVEAIEELREDEDEAREKLEIAAAVSGAAS
jgi:DNA polymerase-1